eukprot:994664-Alexandrium_andersonii.AAC.1
MDLIPEEPQPEEEERPAREAPAPQPMEVEVKAEEGVAADPATPPHAAAVSEPTEGKFSLSVVGKKVVRVVDDLNLRTGAIIEVTREGPGTNPGDPVPEGITVAPAFYNRVFTYTTKSEQFMLQVPRSLSSDEVIRNLQEQVADCDRAVG